MGRRNRETRRTSTQAEADRQADDLAHELGKALRTARQERGLSQRHASEMAGMSASQWSHLEVARDGRGTLATWNRAAFALGSGLKAYLAELSAADLPRDSVHLRHQELVIRTAKPGGWRAMPEEPIDRDVGKSRSADVLLQRRFEYVLVDVWDWFADVGAPARQWRRRLEAVERYAIARMVGDDPLPKIGGIWVVRATQRNRKLIHEHRNFFVSLFPGSGAAWLAALTSPTELMPDQPALLWVTVKGDRLYPVRLGQDGNHSWPSPTQHYWRDSVLRGYSRAQTPLGAGARSARGDVPSAGTAS